MFPSRLLRPRILLLSFFAATCFVWLLWPTGATADVPSWRDEPVSPMHEAYGEGLKVAKVDDSSSQLGEILIAQEDFSLPQTPPAPSPSPSSKSLASLAKDLILGEASARNGSWVS